MNDALTRSTLARPIQRGLTLISYETKTEIANALKPNTTSCLAICATFPKSVLTTNSKWLRQTCLFSVKWKTPRVEAETSHWRHASDPTPQSSTDEFCNWVKEPNLKREWTKIREDNAMLWLFKDASPLCKIAMETIVRHDRPDVTNHVVDGWMTSMSW